MNNNTPLCRNCKRIIPPNANFCPYCGISNPLSNNKFRSIFKGFGGTIENLYDQLISKLDSYIPMLSVKIQQVLRQLEDKIIHTSTPNFVNKNKVLAVLREIRGNLKSNYSKEAENEARLYSSYVEQTISGDRCIICLKTFDTKDGKKISVYACPNCHYAGHRDHFMAWLEEKKICPLCRAEISQKDLIKGYIIEKDSKLILVS